MVPKWILLVGCGLALGGCVQHELIVDTKGVDEAKYEADLADCEAYADRVEPGKRAVQRGAGAAVVGAVVGAAIGDGSTAERIGGALGTTGAAKGIGEAERERTRVLRKCMRGRGYRVLN